MVARCLAALAIVLAGLTQAVAQYPDRPIRLIVPFAPGGVTDTSGRLVADALGKRLGQNVVVENKAGASGNIGTQAVATAPPDGYTLVLGFDGTLVINPHVFPNFPFDPLRDLAPVSLVAESQTVLVVHPSVPAKSVAELVALAKAKPGTLNFGSTGAGGLSHLVGELLKSSTGTQMTHIAYKGTGPATNDLLGGQIQLMFNDTSVPHVKADKLRALAVTGTKRWADLPGVPTMAELGMPGYETYNWFGLFVPAGTPPAIIHQLNRELVAALKEPAMQSWMQARGAEAASSSPEEFAAYIRRDVDKWAKVIKAIGFVPE